MPNRARATLTDALLAVPSQGGPTSLVNSQWRLHLMMGEGRLSQTKDPSAIFEFGLARPDAPAEQQQEEKVVAEFSHDELYSFFLDLEKMQEQIDALS